MVQQFKKMNCDVHHAGVLERPVGTTFVLTQYYCPSLPSNGLVLPVYEFTVLFFSEAVEDIDGASNGFRDWGLWVFGRVFVNMFGYVSSK